MSYMKYFLTASMMLLITYYNTAREYMVPALICYLFYLTYKQTRA